MDGGACGFTRWGNGVSGHDIDEILVVLNDGAQLPGAPITSGHPLHTVSDRVLVLAREGSDPAGLEADAAVRWVGTDPPPEVLAVLGAEERLFVDGWLLRRTPKSERPGDGLAWDAGEGMLPPDLPPNFSGDTTRHDPRGPSDDQGPG